MRRSTGSVIRSSNRARCRCTMSARPCSSSVSRQISRSWSGRRRRMRPSRRSRRRWERSSAASIVRACENSRCCSRPSATHAGWENLLTDDLKFSTDGGIATITINRPSAYNAMKVAMWAGMLEFVQSIEHNPAVRVLVLAGEGKHFCSGADVTEFAQTIDMPPQDLATHWMRQADIINPLFVTLERIPQPVIASVRGIAAGGGLGLVAGADLIIASDTARFFAAQIKLGAIPDSAVSFNLRRAIGVKKAKQYCFLGDEMDAETALDLGLVNW